MKKSIISELGKQLGIAPVKETEETTKTSKTEGTEEAKELDEADEVEEPDGVDDTEQAKKAISEARKKFEAPADEILSPDVPDNEDFSSFFAEIGKKLEEKADEAVEESAEDVPEETPEEPPAADPEPAPEPPADQEPTDSEDHEDNSEDEDDDESDELAAPTFGPTPEPASLPPFPLPVPDQHGPIRGVRELDFYEQISAHIFEYDRAGILSNSLRDWIEDAVIRDKGLAASLIGVISVILDEYPGLEPEIQDVLAARAERKFPYSLRFRNSKKRDGKLYTTWEDAVASIQDLVDAYGVEPKEVFEVVYLRDDGGIFKEVAKSEVVDFINKDYAGTNKTELRKQLLLNKKAAPAPLPNKKKSGD